MTISEIVNLIFQEKCSQKQSSAYMSLPLSLEIRTCCQLRGSPFPIEQKRSSVGNIGILRKLTGEIPENILRVPVGTKGRIATRYRHHRKHALKVLQTHCWYPPNKQSSPGDKNSNFSSLTWKVLRLLSTRLRHPSY